MRRWSLFVLPLTTLSIVASAQSSRAPDSTNVLPQFEFIADRYGGWLVAAFDSIPASKFAFRPTPPQQSIGHIAQHLEAANYSLCERLGGKHPRTAKDSLPEAVKAAWPKDTLVARLEASLRFCDAVLERLGPLNTPQVANSLILFETDLAEHYSQISGYMRVLGMVPPSALPAKSRTAIALPEASLSQFVGGYEFSVGAELAITLNGDALIAKPNTGGAAVRLWPESANEFFVKEVDAQVSFTRGANGAVTGLVLHQFGRNRPAKKM
jgi:uncharacterized damage-inducible protein DinB